MAFVAVEQAVATQVAGPRAPVSIENLGKVFNLSYGEKRLLQSAGVGQGIFFAGNTHVAIRVVASDEEHKAGPRK